MSLSSIIAEIEKRAQGRRIGDLQYIRKDLKEHSRLAGTSIFNPKTIFGEDYAFHYGGRKELQFNVGNDKPGMFRHGVAFSFDPSPTVPKPEESFTLLTSVDRFNDFIGVQGSPFSDMSMWEWDRNRRRDSDRAIAPIGTDLTRRGMFIFIGKMQPVSSINVDLIVNDLDRLLEMYLYVEGRVGLSTLQHDVVAAEFHPGCTVKRRFTTASLAERILNVDLRHNELQFQLYDELQKEHGENNVATEHETGTGRVDVAVRKQNGHLWFYEIKTSRTARNCIREGLAQILEYSYWRPAREPEKIFIVGEPCLDQEADRYLTTLRHRFKIPIEYRQCVLLSYISAEEAGS